MTSNQLIEINRCTENNRVYKQGLERLFTKMKCPFMSWSFEWRLFACAFLAPFRSKYFSNPIRNIRGCKQWRMPSSRCKHHQFRKQLIAAEWSNVNLGTGRMPTPHSLNEKPSTIWRSIEKSIENVPFCCSSRELWNDSSVQFPNFIYRSQSIRVTAFQQSTVDISQSLNEMSCIKCSKCSIETF